MLSHFSGYAVLKCNNGNIFEGEFKDGERNGFGIFISSNGVKVEGNWENDSYCGVMKISPIIKNRGPSENGLGPSENGLGPSENGLGPSENGLGPSENGLGPSENGLGPSENGLGPKDSSDNNKRKAREENGIYTRTRSKS